MQGAIIDTCAWNISDVIACDPAVIPGETMILSAQNMIIGKTYWLLIDGSSGALCQYHIVEAQGILLPNFTQELDPDLLVAVPDVICPGYDSFRVFAGPPVDFEVGYEWTLFSNGESYTILYTTDPEMIFDFDEFSPTGQWEVCVRAVSGCDSTASICTPFEMVSTDFQIMELGNQICGPGDQLGYQWRACGSDLLLSTNQCYTPGNEGCYCLSITSPVGCVSTACIDLTVSTTGEKLITGISVYPNPVSGNLHVDLKHSLRVPARWTLYDQTGIKHATGIISKPLEELKLNETISDGLYILELKDEDGQRSLSKIIVD